VFSAYTLAQQPQPGVQNAVAPTEAQPQFAAYHQDVVQPTASPQHHSYSATAAATGSNVASMPAVQSFNSVALPTQNLL